MIWAVHETTMVTSCIQKLAFVDLATVFQSNRKGGKNPLSELEAKANVFKVQGHQASLDN
jgi:hypothetical protein